VPTIRIRRATASDEGRLWVLLAQAAHTPLGVDVRAEAAAEVRLSAYVAGFGEEPGDVGVLAFEGERCVGGAWARRWSESRHGFVWYPELDVPELVIATDPSQRGRGLGTRLLRALQRACPEGLVLSVREENPARRLYARAGFRELPARAMANPRSGGVSIVMEWRPAR
jgi:ribosomal protein S18 acetylase RimI-like enzyme